MKFNFKIQQYQTDAVDSVVNVFRGQPYQSTVNYRRDIGNIRDMKQYSQLSFTDRDGQTELNLTDDFDETGFMNRSIALTQEVLLANVREVQQNNNLMLSDSLVHNLGSVPLMWRWRPAREKHMYISKRCTSCTGIMAGQSLS